MKALVTGGGGFLGSHLVERLRARGDEPVRRRAAPSYDLTHWDDAAAALRGRAAGARLPPRGRGRRHRREPRQPRPLLVREPDHGRARARAGAPARRREARRSPARSARTRSSRRCRSARRTSGTATRRRRTRRTASRRRRCSSARRPTASSTGSNADLPPAGEPLRAARQLRPRDVARDPGADPEDGRARERRRSCSGATARRRASSSTSRTPPRRSCSPPSATTAPSRSTSARAPRSRSASSPSTIAELTGFEGEIVWDTSMPNGQPRRRSTPREPQELFGFRARTALRDGLARTIAWYRAAGGGPCRRVASHSPRRSPAPSARVAGRLPCGPGDSAGSTFSSTAAAVDGAGAARAVSGSWSRFVGASAVHNSWSSTTTAATSTWYYTSGWVLGHGTSRSRHRLRLPVPARAVRAARRREHARGAAVAIVLNVLVLCPIALLCIYGLAAAIAGRRFAYLRAGLGRACRCSRSRTSYGATT